MVNSDTSDTSEANKRLMSAAHEAQPTDAVNKRPTK